MLSRHNIDSYRSVVVTLIFLNPLAVDTLIINRRRLPISVRAGSSCSAAQHTDDDKDLTTDSALSKAQTHREKDPEAEPFRPFQILKYDGGKKKTLLARLT